MQFPSRFCLLLRISIDRVFWSLVSLPFPRFSDVSLVPFWPGRDAWRDLLTRFGALTENLIGPPLNLCAVSPESTLHATPTRHVPANHKHLQVRLLRMKQTGAQQCAVGDPAMRSCNPAILRSCNPGIRKSCNPRSCKIRPRYYDAEANPKFVARSDLGDLLTCRSEPRAPRPSLRRGRRASRRFQRS